MSGLTFIAYIDRSFALVQAPEPPASTTPYNMAADSEEGDKVVRISSEAKEDYTPKVTISTASFAVLPPGLIACRVNSKGEEVPIRRNRKFLRALLAKVFPQAANPAEWPDVRFRPPYRGKFQIQAVKCLVEPAKAVLFMDELHKETFTQQGVRLYIPPPTHKALVSLGAVMPPMLQRTCDAKDKAKRASSALPATESHWRRSNALYIYTTDRKRGTQTAAGIALDRACKKLPPARLHIPYHGRVIAYCYTMALSTELKDITEFVRGVIVLYANDSHLRITARAPLAIHKLRQCLETLSRDEAATVRRMLGPFNALEEGMKWAKTGHAVPRKTPSTISDPPVIFEVRASSDDTEGVETYQKSVGTEPLEPKETTPAETMVDPSPRPASSGADIVFTVFSMITTGIASTVQLHHLLQNIPAGPSFTPDQVGDYAAASLRLERSNTDAVIEMLATTMTLKDNNFRFIVNEEAEVWLDGLLDEFDEKDVAVVREVWVRQT